MANKRQKIKPLNWGFFFFSKINLKHLTKSKYFYNLFLPNLKGEIYEDTNCNLRFKGLGF